jgi:hypothetical protein
VWHLHDVLHILIDNMNKLCTQHLALGLIGKDEQWQKASNTDSLPVYNNTTPNSAHGKNMYSSSCTHHDPHQAVQSPLPMTPAHSNQFPPCPPSPLVQSDELAKETLSKRKQKEM